MFWHVKDSTSPMILHTVPAHTYPASEASPGTDITLYFSEAVQASSMMLMVTIIAGDSVRRIPVDNSDAAVGRVTVYGSIVTIHPFEGLGYNKAISVSVDAGALPEFAASAQPDATPPHPGVEIKC